jgi:hypothetical protein
MDLSKDALEETSVYREQWTMMRHVQTKLLVQHIPGHATVH